CNGKRRSLSGSGAVRSHMAAMHVYDALDDRQAQPRRTLAGGGLCGQPLEAAKQSPEILRRQAGALVGDADDGAVAFMGNENRNLAADRRVFDGIADEI